jgi:hypothetical protein
MDKNRLRYLESVENVRAALRARSGRTPNATVAREITSCVQQGRQFFEAAATSPLEIRPLVQFYGVLGYARAIVLGQRMCSLSTLVQCHGLRDTSKAGSTVVNLSACIGARGTFVEFNDVASQLNRVCYHDAQTHPASVRVPTSKSAELLGLEINIKDVLARMPAMAELYAATFSEPAKCAPLDQLHYDTRGNYWTTRVFGQSRVLSRGDLRTIMSMWRERFPYLDRWHVIEAVPAYGEAYITLAALERSTDDLAEPALPEIEPGHFVAVLRDAPPPEVPRIPLDQIFLGVGGGYFGSSAYAIAPISGRYISEFSWAYAGLFLLSSLVRYRPDVWSHAVSRSSLSERPADDQALALVHEFLETTSSAIPALVVQALDPREDKYA